MNSYVVIIGAQGKEGEGLSSTVPMDYDKAYGVCAEARLLFAYAKEKYGDKAFPYGEPFVEMVLIEPFKTTQVLAQNFIYDERFDETVCDWDCSTHDVKDFRGERICKPCRSSILRDEILSAVEDI